jgi:tetratricopeptide (TPR) repeat protein
MLPRWRQSRTTAFLGELATEVPPDRAPPDLEEILRERRGEWEEHRTQSHASDFISVAIAAHQATEADEAARFILDGTESHPLIHRLASVALGNDRTSNPSPDDEESVVTSARTAIQDSRLRLRRDPRLATAWSDLARAQAILGNFDKAKAAMRIALILAPDSRLFLRGASRLFAESGQPDEAHAVLLRSPRSLVDPWVMAAEIAASDEAGHRSEAARKARRLLEDGALAPFHAAELAGALSGLEFQNGSARRGRQLLRQSLLDPTDNTVAQAQWMLEQLGELGIDVPLGMPFSFEARAHALADEGRWAEALHESHRWFHDEPFSSRPAVFASWVAETGLEDYPEAVRAARAGLHVHPGDFRLRNNLVFALASDNKLVEAVEEFQRTDITSLSREEKPFVLATGGLIAYRTGDLDLGRRSYESAASQATGPAASKIRALAALYSAREMLLALSEDAPQIADAALRESEDVQTADVAIVRSRVQELFDGLAPMSPRKRR